METQSAERNWDAANYALLERQVASLLEDERDFIANAANFASFVYSAVPAVNWAGFYFPADDGLVLGPFAGKPACTRLPAGNGVCNRALDSARTIVVDDVNAFGDHIACDSASRSEIVIPMVVEGTVCGVFDIDSPVRARFNDSDKTGLEALVAGFLSLTSIPQRHRRRKPDPSRLTERIEIQTCRDHHSVLRYLLDEFSTTDADAGSSLALLKRLRTVILAHLKIEDEWLYPRLSRSENEIVRGKAERYRREMSSLRADFDALWSTWGHVEAISAHAEVWRAELRLFRAALLARMDSEDHDLYVAAEADLS